MKNIISKLKQNWLSLLLPIIFVSFLLINLNVVYFGDDYYYLTFRNLDFSEYFTKLAGHYLNDNGRFIVHMLATLFLKLPLPFWAILNSLFLTGICYFASKVITSNKKENLPLLCSIIFFFLAALDISITRQSVYWLTGSFNYVYPLLLFFAYWFFLTKIEKKTYFILAIILGLLSSATMEQSAMMTFGLTILVTLSHWKSSHKIKAFINENKKLFLLSFITLLGLCTVILAPSQFKRIELENAKETNETSISITILKNAETILSQYTTSNQIIPYCILFNLLGFIYTLKNGNKKEKYIFSSLIFLNLFCTLTATFLPSSITWDKYLLWIILFLNYGISLIYLNTKIYSSFISPLTISAVLLLGSQLMMIVSPVLGPRNFIFGFVLFAYIIALLANSISFRYKWIPTSIFIIIALVINLKTANGYYQTRLTEIKNQELLAISNDILKDETQTITLYRFPNDNYGWSMPYLSSYHEFYFKHFYQIHCLINWKLQENL